MSNKMLKNNDEKTESAPNHKFIASLIVLSIAVLLFAAVAFTFLSDKKLSIAGQKLDVEVVDTSESREYGLSGRERIGDNQGMLFTYFGEDIYCLWMKDMKFSLDMIWFNKNKEVVFIEENVKADSYPKPFCNDKYAKYVLEVNAGSIQKWGLKVGDKATF